MPDSDDSSLLRIFCASRDEDTFTRLVRRYLPMVQAVALRRLGSAPASASTLAPILFPGPDASARVCPSRERRP